MPVSVGPSALAGGEGDRGRGPARGHLDPALGRADRRVETLLEAERPDVEVQGGVLVADGDADRADVGHGGHACCLLCCGVGGVGLAVHERTGGGEGLAGLQPGLEAGEDHRPAAVELWRGVVGQLVVGDGQPARVADRLDLPGHPRRAGALRPPRSTGCASSGPAGAAGRRQGSRLRRAGGRRPGARACSVEPGVQSDWTPTPKWYLARMAGSVIASHSRSGVVRM